MVTLAMLLFARGAALTLADNAPVMVDFAAGFTELGSVHVGPVPLPVIITAVLYAICALLLNRTRFGRHVLAIGGNEEAARLAGIPVGRTLLLGLIFVILNFERGQGTFQLNSFWENLIRGAFLLVVVIVQSRLERRGMVRGGGSG